MDASGILLALDLGLSSLVIDELILSVRTLLIQLGIDIFRREWRNLPLVFGTIKNLLVLIDSRIPYEALVHVDVGYHHIPSGLAFKALVFTLLEVENWLISDIVFLTVIKAIKSGRVNFTDVVQI